MKIVESERQVERWLSSRPNLKRDTVTVKRTIFAEPATIFPLLCPTAEYDWIPGWNCELLHSHSGRAEENCIFRTDTLGMREIWVCTHYEPNKTIHYSRTAEDFCLKLEIDLKPLASLKTAITWKIIASAVTEEGNNLVEKSTEIRNRVVEVVRLLSQHVASKSGT